jgi:hypothetical protein
MVRFGNDKIILTKNNFVDNLLRFRNSQEKLMALGLQIERVKSLKVIC